jgi:hypothetical protein
MLETTTGDRVANMRAFAGVAPAQLRERSVSYAVK